MLPEHAAAGVMSLMAGDDLSLTSGLHILVAAPRSGA